MFLTLSRFVLRLLPVTDRNSQLLIPKKNAPQDNCPSASSIGVVVFRSIDLNTDGGSAFCCFCAGSASTYPESCRVRNRDCRWSLSRAGSGRRFVRKVERTFVTVDLTVPPLSMVLPCLPYLFRLQLVANADMRNCRCFLLYFSRNSSSIPMSARNRTHRSKHPVCFWMDAGASPASWSMMHLAKASRRLFRWAEERDENSSASVWGREGETCG